MSTPDDQSEPVDVLIVANSARYLSQSACRGGFRPWVVDAFGDGDTRAAATGFHQSDAMTADALGKAVLASGDGPVPRDDCGWVYGAGFEAEPAVLRRLAMAGECLGNEAGVLELTGDPRAWFALLDRLAISHPQWRLTHPGQAGWLRKQADGYGGGGVRRVDAGDVPAGPESAGSYYQREMDGALISLLFAADGRQARVIGFNALEVVNRDEGDFRYTGAVALDRLDDPAGRTMVRAAQQLTAELGLRGVNGLDFIVIDGQALLLELNARPPATLELHENRLLSGDLPRGGLRAHVGACRGVLPAIGTSAVRRGSRVLYSPETVAITTANWPRWCADLPTVGSWVEVGSPLCTVFADGLSTAAVRRSLDARAEVVLRRFHSTAQEAA